VSWQTIVVGDPLCAPFPRKALQPAEIDPGLDPDTELPSRFSARRLQTLTEQGTKPEAAKALLRADARTAKGDQAGARAALVEATALDPRLVTAHLTLAAAFEEQKDYDKAIERYRQVLTVNPNDPIALNNLAYALAVHRGKAAEALPYAELAMKVARGRSIEIADTLAWVQHLLGRDREAAEIMARVVKAAPDRALLRLHAAVVFAAVGNMTDAAVELREAVRLDPSLEVSDEVKALRAKIK
jgi:tetratricopeptide (TPR) repeat protein